MIIFIKKLNVLLFLALGLVVFLCTTGCDKTSQTAAFSSETIGLSGVVGFRLIIDSPLLVDGETWIHNRVGEQIPLVISCFTDSGTPYKDLDIVLSHNLEGEFYPDDTTVRTDDFGSAATIFVPKESGTLVISAAAVSECVSAVFQIETATTKSFVIKTIVGSEILTPEQKIPVQVLVTDSANKPVDRQKVYFSCLNGTFEDSENVYSTETDELGYATTYYKAGTTLGQDFITVLCNGCVNNCNVMVAE